MRYCECREVVSRVVAYLQTEVCAPLAAARTIKTSPHPLTDAVRDIARLTLCDATQEPTTPLPASLLSLCP